MTTRVGSTHCLVMTTMTFKTLTELMINTYDGASKYNMAGVPDSYIPGGGTGSSGVGNVGSHGGGSSSSKIKIADVPMTVQIVSVDNGYPYGISCSDCGAAFIDGDVVLAGQQRLVGWIGWHTRCLKVTLDEAPLDQYEIIKNKLANGEDPFE